MNDLDIMRMAYVFAYFHSDDPRTQNGAVLAVKDEYGQDEFVGHGTNRLPHGVKYHQGRLTQDEKLKWLIHAEVDAILDAGQVAGTLGGILYCPWACCADCAKVIIQAGIRKVITHGPMLDKTPDFWKESIAIGKQMLEEAGVGYDILTEKIDGCTNLFRGEVWTP